MQLPFFLYQYYLIPAVQNVLTDRFGINRVSSKNTEQDTIVRSLKHNRASESEVLTSIVRGLAMVGCREENLIEDIADNDYGVWDSVENDFIPIIKKGTPVKDTVFDKLTQQGIYEEVQCLDRDVSSVQVLVYQNTLNGFQKLGTINIPNPGGKKYKVYMQINKRTGMLVVTLYDSVYKRWIDEIPLNERQYTVK